MPLFITIHFVGRDEERIINAEKISIMTRKQGKPEDPNDHDRTEIVFDGGLILNGVRETPEDIRDLIKTAVQSTTQVVGNLLIAMGFLH